MSLSKNEYTVIDSGLIVPRGYDTTKTFMKHGPEVKPKRFYSIEQTVQDPRSPVQLRKEAFDKITHPFYCGYSFMPLKKDKRKRKVSLVECLEGARIYAFSHQVPGNKIKMRPYADSARVRKEGAEVYVEVPSRESEEPEKLKLISFAVVDTKEKHAIALGIGSDHSCGAKRFNIRFRYSEDKESSGVVNLCCHEGAGYFESADWFLNERHNRVPVDMNQFAIPSQFTVRNYLKALNNLLIKDENLKSKNKLRKPHIGEKEIFLWDLVRLFGHDETFFCKATRDGLLANYNWKVD